mmetsp:Transcript_51933/g.124310  ORF Transcript_51933/g.124310 Transcript_51933/m.124310 type:complete len:337 (+) Transcript_51933:289-1299(+)
MKWIKVVPCLDALRRQMIPQLVSSLTVFRLHAKDPRSIYLPLLDAAQLGNSSQSFSIPVRHLPSMLHQSGKHLHLRANKGCAQAIHFGIGGSLKVEKVIRRIKAVIDERLEAVMMLLIFCMHPAAISGCDGLVGVQRCHRKVAEGPHQFSGVCFGAHGFANVLHQPPSFLFAKLADGGDVAASNTVSVTHDDRFRPWRRLLFQLGNARIHGALGAVTVDGLGAHHLHHVGDGDHGQGWDEHMVMGTEVAGQQCHVQRGRAGGGRQGHRHLVELADFCCQLPWPGRPGGDLATHHGLHHVVHTLPGVVGLQDPVEPTALRRLRLRRWHRLLNPLWQN